MSRLSASILLCCALAFFGCCPMTGDPPAQNTSASRAGTYYGDRRPVGDGAVQTWVKLDDTGEPLAVGVTFTESALRNLPATDAEACCGTEYAMALPPQASCTAFNHVAVNWNSRGHEPAGIYDKPHFDVHFYILDPKVRAAMTGEGDDKARYLKPPTTQCVPADYIMVPIVVPRMGVHFADMTSGEFRGQPFTTTFLYGYYNGQLAFVEPMLTKAFLDSKPDFSQSIKLPAAYAKSGCCYPTRYSVRWNEQAKGWDVALEGMVER